VAAKKPRRNGHAGPLADVLWVGTTAAGINGIPGDVVINGGGVEDSGERIADSAIITINDGSFKLQIR
jgi:hypothetical protein